MVHDKEGHQCAIIKHSEGYGQGNPQAMNLFAINTLELLDSEDDLEGTDHNNIGMSNEQEDTTKKLRELGIGLGVKGMSIDVEDLTQSSDTQNRKEASTSSHSFPSKALSVSMPPPHQHGSSGSVSPHLQLPPQYFLHRSHHH